MQELRLTLDLESTNPPEPLSRDLSAALLEQPAVRSVEHLTPKTLEIDWNTLLVTLAASGGVLTTLITAVQGWVKSRQEVSVTITLDGDTLTIDGRGPYSEKQQAAIDTFLARHRGFVLPE